MKIVIRMGRLIHKLQKERDMTILYIGKLGPGTKAFLLKNYEETDDAFAVGTSRSRGGSGGGGHSLSKRVGVCCQESGTPFQTRGDPFPDESKTNIYPIVDKQFMLVCSVS